MAFPPEQIALLCVGARLKLPSLSFLALSKQIVTSKLQQLALT